MLSSSTVQDPFPLMTGGLDNDCHLVRQSIAVLFGKLPAISFHRGDAVDANGQRAKNKEYFNSTKEMKSALKRIGKMWTTRQGYMIE
mmetsp:Transcript_24084/g.32052  ORF Transcript_24084/g.32052 Transcript_24084/m.32052 type:complete len:87 (-) Transcript_24084:1549-1809(-)